MTLVVVLILLALWAAVLGPGLYRRYREERSVGSIDLFHHELRLLARAGPKIVRPAFQLTAARAAGAAPDTSHLPAISSRPGRAPLVLLEPVRTGAGTASVDQDEELLDDASGRYYRRVVPPRLEAVPDSGYADQWPYAGGASERRAEPLSEHVQAYHHRQVLRRRRDTLLALVATVVLTAPLGAVHSLHVLWVCTVLGAIGLACYIGLAAYAQILEADRQERLPGGALAARHPRSGRVVADGDDGGASWSAPGRLRSSGSYGRGGGRRRGRPRRSVAAGYPQGGGEVLHPRWAARAGYPGAWDETGEDGLFEPYLEPRTASGGY